MMFRTRNLLLVLALGIVACAVAPTDPLIPEPEEPFEEEQEEQEEQEEPQDTTVSAVETAGCPGTSVPNPAVLFCDSFESGAPSSLWSDYGDGSGAFLAVPDVGIGDSPAMRVAYAPGQVAAGWLSVGLGEIPSDYAWFDRGIGEGKIREIYWREYIRLGAGWDGVPWKHSRVRVLDDPEPDDLGPWRSAFQGHLWPEHDDSPGVLMFDNTRGVNASGEVVDRGNNTNTSTWLPRTVGASTIYGTRPNGTDWMCIEAHIRLNDPGEANGVEEFWLDGVLQARRTNQNHIGTYERYGINQVSFDNYWNGGSPQANTLYRDNIVVSTDRIGCL